MAFEPRAGALAKVRPVSLQVVLATARTEKPLLLELFGESFRTALVTVPVRFRRSNRRYAVIAGEASTRRMELVP